ncbi:MAG TPA: aspartate aminotransferase family protein [Terriglobales bacterium]|nr:aspartate aminotransferase family protein [Terriglobales bacterium]
MKNGLEAVMQRESKLLLPTYERFPVLFKHGEGVYLFDDSGRKYLDFLSGIGVNALGYAHPAITKTIAEQSARLVHVSNLFYHEYQAQLAELLTAKSDLDRAFFCNSGTEAWEGALKLARAYARHLANGSKPKTRLLVMENSFHGRTFGALATTGQKKYRAPFAPLVPGVTFVRFNDVADLRKKYNDTVCAVGMETVQGEGGIRPVSQEFLATARELTEKAKAALILDEIQCGLGRTGRYFAYQHYGVRPDIVTVAKPLAAGLPLGAILTTNEIASAFHPGMHGTTFGGGPLACSVAVACIEELDRASLVKHAAELGSHFRDALLALKAKYVEIKEVRGLGLMIGVELTSADLAKSIVTKMLERGIVINRTNNNVLRFLPPYLVTREHVDQVCSALDDILGSETAASTQKKESHE